MKLSISRIKWYMRMLMAMNLREYMFKYFSVALGIMGAILVISVLSQVNIIGAPSGVFVKILLNLLVVIYGVMSFSFISKIFIQFHRKDSSIQAFALPASLLEKYIASVVFIFVVSLVLMLAGYIVTSLFMYLLTKGWLWHRLAFIKLYDFIPDNIARFSILFSFFLFGSVLFKTSQFFKTIILFVALSLLFNVTLFIYTFVYNDIYNMHFFMRTSSIDIQGILLVVSGILIVLGYFRFKRLQYR